MNTVVFLTLLGFVADVRGTGRLLEPPQRSSLWRDPYNYQNRLVRKNYQDHTLNCGGLWKRNLFKGKCGVCGDPWDAEIPRPNEAGGIYAQGVIGRTYYADKGFIDVEVQVMSSIQGYFEFRICPNNDVTKTVTQDCLDQYLLNIFSRDRTASYGSKYYPDEIKPGKAGLVDLSLEMPEGVVCSQCVLQWKWHGGNNWGRCDDGVTSQRGCGPQTEYYNCADIAILERETTTSTTTEPTTTESTTPEPTTTESTTPEPTTTESTTPEPTTTESTTPEPTTTESTTPEPTTAESTTPEPTTTESTTPEPTTAESTTPEPTTAESTTPETTTTESTTPEPTTEESTTPEPTTAESTTPEPTTTESTTPEPTTAESTTPEPTTAESTTPEPTTTESTTPESTTPEEMTSGATAVSTTQQTATAESFTSEATPTPIVGGSTVTATATPIVTGTDTPSTETAAETNILDLNIPGGDAHFFSAMTRK